MVRESSVVFMLRPPYLSNLYPARRADGDNVAAALPKDSLHPFAESLQPVQGDKGLGGAAKAAAVDKAMLYECSGNVIALNNPKRLAVIQGLKDCIVAESGNVLLICKKDDEQRIKQFVADAKIKYGKEYN